MTNTVLLLCAAISGTSSSEVVLLDFTASYCGPCRQMNPIIERMKEQGYPVRKVDITERPALARQFSVERIPTFLLLVRGREVRRVTGICPESKLKQMLVTAAQGLKRERAESLAHSDATAASARESAAETRRRVRAPARQEPRRGTGLPLVGRLLSRTEEVAPADQPGSDAIVRANLDEPDDPPTAVVGSDPHAASVRIRIRNESELNLGSGTIIENLPGRSVILTCGHLLDQLGPDARLEIDVFMNGRSRTYVGKALQYDMKADVGLIEIRTMTSLPVAEPAESDKRLAVGDDLFSIGCSRGEDPSRRDVRLTALNRYRGPDNIECTVVPLHGRSGGGLFAADGTLVGVCSAADHEDKRGLYAGRSAVQEFLTKNGFSHLFGNPKPEREPDGPVTAAAGAAPRPGRLPDSKIADDSFEVSPHSGRFDVKAPHAIEQAEVTCVIRPRNPGERSRVVVIHRASSRFVKWLQGELDAQPQPAMHTVTADVAATGKPAAPAPEPSVARTSTPSNFPESGFGRHSARTSGRVESAPRRYRRTRESRR